MELNRIRELGRERGGEIRREGVMMPLFGNGIRQFLKITGGEKKHHKVYSASRAVRRLLCLMDRDRRRTWHWKKDAQKEKDKSDWQGTEKERQLCLLNRQRGERACFPLSVSDSRTISLIMWRRLCVRATERQRDRDTGGWEWTRTEIPRDLIRQHYFFVFILEISATQTFVWNKNCRQKANICAFGLQLKVRSVKIIHVLEIWFLFFYYTSLILHSHLCVDSGRWIDSVCPPNWTLDPEEIAAVLWPRLKMY